jgi:hypothetical protein
MSLASTIAARSNTPDYGWALEDAAGSSSAAALYGGVAMSKSASGITFGSTPYVVPDGINKACALSGSSSQLYASVAFPGDGDYTFECFIRSTTSSLSLLISNDTVNDGTGAGFWLGVSQSNQGDVTFSSAINQVRAFVGTTTSLGSGSGGVGPGGTVMPNVCNGQPHYIVAVRRSGGIEVWVDGELYKNQSVTLQHLGTANALLGLGAFPSTNSFNYAGSMNYALYSKRAISVSEITATQTAFADASAQEVFAASPAVIAKATYGQIVALTRTSGPSWTAGNPGSPTFTVSGNSVTKISQRVLDGSTAEIVLDTTSSALFSYTIQTTAGVGVGQGTTCTTSTVVNYNETYTSSSVTAGGKNCTLLTPRNSPVNGRGQHFVVWCHGAGENDASVTSGNKLPVIQALCGQGWYVIASAAEAGSTPVDDWGNGSGEMDYAAAYTYMTTNYPSLSKCITAGQSMGGLASLNLYSGQHGTFSKAAAWIGFAPCANQDDLGAPQSGYSSWHDNICNSFGLSLSTVAGDSTWNSAILPHEPTNYSVSVWSGKYLKAWASSSDTGVNKTFNADLLISHAASGGAASATSVACSGPHLDPDQFRPSEVLAFLQPIVDPTDATAPTVPTSLLVTPGVHQNVLTWTASTDSDDAAGTLVYKIYDNANNLIATTAPGVVTYTHSGLTPGTTHTYRVSAVDPAGNESAKTTVDGNSSGIPLSNVPSVPGAPSAGSITYNVPLSWAVVSGASGYKVYRAGALVGSPASNSFTDTNVPAGSYTYTLKSSASDGDSAAGSGTTVNVSGGGVRVTVF